MTTTNLALFEKFQKEFHCYPDGKVSLTQRGLKRLLGLSAGTWSSSKYKFKSGVCILSPKIDEYLATRGINPDCILDENGRIPDIISSLIINYYAFGGNKQAQELSDFLMAMSLRSIGQSISGYRQAPKRRLTEEELAEICIMPESSQWEKRFSDKFYKQLARLTKTKYTGSQKKPIYWAKLTKELVYDRLPKGIYEKVKECKEKTNNYDKLHQFLSEEGIKILKDHQRTLLSLMYSANNVDDLKGMLNASIANEEYTSIYVDTTSSKYLLI